LYNVKVREIIKELELVGWVQIRQSGSHRHFKHTVHPGSVCVAGNMGDEVPKGTLGNIGAGWIGKEATMTEYTIVIEDAGTNYAAYAPDVPGCIATGVSIDEVTATLREAIAEHLEILRDMGEDIPVPHSRAGVIQIAS
jgi:predicted RNA binding protein YcfA (HicA-like mRNA interferase family)/predicted RNase H-like HicB family nuclease